MTPRLPELLRQRQAIAAHLAWLDAQIAEAREEAGEGAPPASVPLRSPAPLPAPVATVSVAREAVVEKTGGEIALNAGGFSHRVSAAALKKDAESGLWQLAVVVLLLVAGLVGVAAWFFWPRPGDPPKLRNVPGAVAPGRP